MARSLTKSPAASPALEVAREALPAYSSPFSRKDFTWHLLFVNLGAALRARKANSQERGTRHLFLTHNLMIIRRFQYRGFQQSKAECKVIKIRTRKSRSV